MTALHIEVGTPEELTPDGIAWLNRNEAETAFYYVSEKRDAEARRRTQSINSALSYIESRRESYAWRFAGPQFRSPSILDRIRAWWRQFCGERPKRNYIPSIFTQPQPEQPPVEESYIIG